MKGVDEVDDQRILALFAQRDETALRELSGKYGGACRKIAAEILGSEEDAKEILNDALLNLWNAIPPAQPDDLFKYLCASVRQLAYQRVRKQNAGKRDSGKHPLSLDDETAIQIPAQDTVESVLNESMMVDAMNRFLDTVSADARKVFIQRYGNERSIKEIAAMYRIKQSTVLVMLMRTRKKLWAWFKKEEWL